MTDAEEAIERLTHWIRDFGYMNTVTFNSDVMLVLAIAKEAIRTADDRIPADASGHGSRVEAVAYPYDASAVTACTCHERDGSRVCEFCRLLGYRGHCE